MANGTIVRFFCTRSLFNDELTTCFHEFSVTKYLRIFQETDFVYSDALLM